MISLWLSVLLSFYAYRALSFSYGIFALSTQWAMAGRDRICNCPQWSFVGPAKNMVATETVSRVYTGVQGMANKKIKQ